MRIRNCLKCGVSVLAGVLMFGMGACSGEKSKQTSEAEEVVEELALEAQSDEQIVSNFPIKFLNDDIVGVAILRPEEVLKSFDGSISNGQIQLPADLKKNISERDLKEMNELLADTEGIDRSRVVLMAYVPDGYSDEEYYEHVEPIAYVRVTNAEALEKSLLKHSWVKSEEDGGVVYIEGSRSKIVVVDGYAWYLETRESAVSIVKNLIAKAKSNPLADWKKAKIGRNLNKETVAFGSVDLSKMFTMFSYTVSGMMTLDFQGSKAEIVADLYGNSGNPFDISKFVTVGNIGATAKYLGQGDMFAFALAENGLLDKYLSEQSKKMNKQQVEMMRMLSGSLFLSANMKKSRMQDFSDMSNYQMVMGIGCKPEKVDKLFAEFKKLPAVEAYGDGIKFSYPGVGTIYGKVDGNHVVIYTDGYDKENRLGVDALKDYVSWATLNLSPEFGIFQQAGIKYGVKARFNSTSTSSTLTVDISGSEYSFIHAILDMVLTAKNNL